MKKTAGKKRVPPRGNEKDQPGEEEWVIREKRLRQEKTAYGSPGGGHR